METNNIASCTTTKKDPALARPILVGLTPANNIKAEPIIMNKPIRIRNATIWRIRTKYFFISSVFIIFRSAKIRKFLETNPHGSAIISFYRMIYCQSFLKRHFGKLFAA